MVLLELDFFLLYEPGVPAVYTYLRVEIELLCRNQWGTGQSSSCYSSIFPLGSLDKNLPQVKVGNEKKYIDNQVILRTTKRLQQNVWGWGEMGENYKDTAEERRNPNTTLPG